VPKVSVIIPCYNLGQYLNEAVDSVLAQSIQDFEIIIVNDGSTDDFTNELLANYNKPKTRVLSQTNRGLPGARNSGIKVSSGEYVLCLDADDKLHYEFLEKTVSILDADYEHVCAFVMPWVQLFGDLDFIWETSEFDPYLLAMRHGMHVTAPFRKECWDAVGGFREHMTSGYEDWDFWLSIVALGYKWVTVKEPIFYYRKRKNSMLTKSNQKKLETFRQIIRNNEEFYRKNYEEIIVRGLEYFESKLKICEVDRAPRIEGINTHGQRQIELEAECHNLHLQIDNITKELKAIRSSRSWKITAPFRATLELFRRSKR